MIRNCALAAFLVLCAEQVAYSVPVRVNGYVADLTGVPHEQPDITVVIRDNDSNVIASGKANADGSFSIGIDSDKVPDTNVTLSITASGTAILSGQRVGVSTNASLIGLAGEIAAGLAARFPDTTTPVNYFIVLVVPKSTPTPTTCVRRCTSSCVRYYRYTCRRRCR